MREGDCKNAPHSQILILCRLIFLPNVLFSFHLPHLKHIVLRKTGLREKSQNIFSGWLGHSSEKQGIEKKKWSLPISIPHLSCPQSVLSSQYTWPITCGVRCWTLETSSFQWSHVCSNTGFSLHTNTMKSDPSSVQWSFLKILIYELVLNEIF